jgi:hypothetical protein
LKWSLGGPLSKLCVTPPFSINFRCQIENQVSDYRLLGASSFITRWTIQALESLWFSFGHCVVCPSSIYRFLWYLQALLKTKFLSLAYDDKLFYFRFIYELCINRNEICMIKWSAIYRWSRGTVKGRKQLFSFIFSLPENCHPGC